MASRFAKDRNSDDEDLDILKAAALASMTKKQPIPSKKQHALDFLMDQLKKPVRPLHQQPQKDPSMTRPPQANFAPSQPPNMVRPLLAGLNPFAAPFVPPRPLMSQAASFPPAPQFLQAQPSFGNNFAMRATSLNHATRVAAPRMLNRGRGGNRGARRGANNRANSNKSEEVKKDDASNFILPQHKWAGNSSSSKATDVLDSPSRKDKFRRYDDSESEDEDDDIDDEVPKHDSGEEIVHESQATPERIAFTATDEDSEAVKDDEKEKDLTDIDGEDHDVELRPPSRSSTSSSINWKSDSSPSKPLGEDRDSLGRSPGKRSASPSQQCSDSENRTKSKSPNQRTRFSRSSLSSSSSDSISPAQLQRDSLSPLSNRRGCGSRPRRRSSSSPPKAKRSPSPIAAPKAGDLIAAGDQKRLPVSPRQRTSKQSSRRLSPLSKQKKSPSCQISEDKPKSTSRKRRRSTRFDPSSGTWIESDLSDVSLSDDEKDATMSTTQVKDGISQLAHDATADVSEAEESASSKELPVDDFVESIGVDDVAEVQLALECTMFTDSEDDLDDDIPWKKRRTTQDSAQKTRESKKRSKKAKRKKSRSATPERSSRHTKPSASSMSKPAVRESSSGSTSSRRKSKARRADYVTRRRSTSTERDQRSSKLKRDEREADISNRKEAIKRELEEVSDMILKKFSTEHRSGKKKSVLKERLGRTPSPAPDRSTGNQNKRDILGKIHVTVENDNVQDSKKRGSALSRLGSQRKEESRSKRASRSNSREKERRRGRARSHEAKRRVSPQARNRDLDFEARVDARIQRVRRREQDRLVRLKRVEEDRKKYS